MQMSLLEFYSSRVAVGKGLRIAGWGVNVGFVCPQNVGWLRCLMDVVHNVPRGRGRSGLLCDLQFLGLDGYGSSQEPRLALLLQPIALALDVDRRRVVEQPVEDRGRQDLVVEDLTPVQEALVAGEDEARPLVPAGRP